MSFCLEEIKTSVEQVSPSNLTVQTRSRYTVFLKKIGAPMCAGSFPLSTRAAVAHQNTEGRADPAPKQLARTTSSE